MGDNSSNEYSLSARAEKDSNDLFAAIGKRVLGVQSAEDNENIPDDERVKIVDESESLCMNCEQNGTTRLLLTKIPFFREIILMSFYCDHCRWKNTEVQPAGEIQEQGSKYIFRCETEDDLSRQVVKSDTSILVIEDLSIELPPGRGRLTNVEGIISEVIKDLESGQKDRQKNDPEMHGKIAQVVQNLLNLSSSRKFTISLDDPAGNSWIEPSPADNDASVKGKYSHTQYPRSAAQNALLGLADTPADAQNGTTAEVVAQVDGGIEDVDILEGKAYELPISCPGCSKPAHLVLQMVSIPYFKQVVLSTTKCDHCSYHVSDVKTGGEIPAMGKRIWLDVKGPDDLGRDILKSETCLLRIPECKVEVVPGTMGGRFTTVEGLVTQIRNDLKGSIFDTDAEEIPDSMPSEKKKAWGEFFSTLNKAIKGEMPFTVMMEDALDSSYCQTRGEPGTDPQVRTEEYERTAEEEDELGLSDMKTHLNDKGEYVKEPTGMEELFKVPAAKEVKSKGPIFRDPAVLKTP